MENKKPWKRLSARSQSVLHCDTNILVRREKVRLGSLYFGSRNDMVIKSEHTLPVFYAQNPPINERTNLGDFCNEISPELDMLLEQAIETVKRSLRVEPGTSREEAQALHDVFKENMGLMLFGLICNLVPVNFLKEKIGEQFTLSQDLILRPHQQTLLGREVQAIADIQKVMHEKTEEWISAEAQKLAETYGFIHSEYVSQSWTATDYLREIYATELDSPTQHREELPHFSGYEVWLISVIQRLTYLLDEGKSAVVRANWALRQTFKNLGYTDDLLLLTSDEFTRWVEEGILPNATEFEARKLYFGILSVDEEYKFYSGKGAIETLIKEQEIVEQNFENVTSVTGSVAAKGYAKGRVVRVFTQEDCKKLNQGDILVASMTTPAYIEAMRRAGAFITDEGGVICHAAIVAREFGKPCIVGTKIATQVLKDGDLVEVDAHNGVVKIIR